MLFPELLLIYKINMEAFAISCYDKTWQGKHKIRCTRHHTFIISMTTTLTQQAN